MQRRQVIRVAARDALSAEAGVSDDTEWSWLDGVEQDERARSTR
jgi:hypothetical protein